MRIKHWYKALIVFSGPLFSKMLTTNIPSLIATFFAFGFIASSIYVINDLKDIQKDKLHPRKKNRPIASGKISKTTAKFFTSILFLLAVFLGYLVNTYVLLLVLTYFVLMLAYTYYIKTWAIFDAFIISLGFFIRALAGCLALNIKITTWFYLIIIFVANYLAFCKRLTEIKVSKKGHKKNLKDYKQIIEIAISISGALAITLYAIYAALTMPSLVWSVPFAFIGLLIHLKLTYQGKEVHEMIKDKQIYVAGILFLITLALGLYFL